MGVKTSSGVYFYVGRNSPYPTTKTAIPYEVERLNIGGAMNLASGVFTAPVSGRYQFNFVAQKNDRIDTYLIKGSINDDSTFYNTQFTGILLEEDLVLS